MTVELRSSVIRAVHRDTIVIFSTLFLTKSQCSIKRILQQNQSEFMKYKAEVILVNFRAVHQIAALNFSELFSVKSCT